MAKAEEYPILITPLSKEDGGGFIAIVPDLTGCMSDGETREEALTNVQQAILEWIDAASQAGKGVPEPYSAQARAMKQKQALEAKVKEQAKAIATLDGEIKSLRLDIEAFRIDVEAFGASWSTMISLPKNHKDKAEDVVH
jgi:antitoxin HicB